MRLYGGQKTDTEHKKTQQDLRLVTLSEYVDSEFFGVYKNTIISITYTHPQSFNRSTINIFEIRQTYTGLKKRSSVKNKNRLEYSVFTRRYAVSFQKARNPRHSIQVVDIPEQRAKTIWKNQRRTPVVGTRHSLRGP